MYAVDGGGSCPSATSTTCPGTPAPAGADRQRRRGPAPERRPRRGDDRARPGPRRRGLAETGTAWSLQRTLVDELATLARAGQRPLGDPRRAAALHPLAGDGVGGVRPGGRGPSRSTASTARSTVARDARRGARGDPRARVRRRAKHVRPALRHDRGRRVAAAVRWSASSPATTRGCSGTIEAVEQDLMRDGWCCATAPQSGVDGLDGDEHPFLACSFWLVAAYAAAGRVDEAEALMDRLVAAGQRRRPALRGVRPGRGSGWSATSRRRSPTSPSCRRGPRPAVSRNEGRGGARAGSCRERRPGSPRGRPRGGGDGTPRCSWSTPRRLARRAGTRRCARGGAGRTC